jgi:hypothetical protein
MESKDQLFRFGLNVKVYFQEKGENFEGTIISRIYSEDYQYADWDSGIDKDSIVNYVRYKVSYTYGSIEFKDWEFGTKVYLDKKKFIEEKVIIK